MRTDPGNLRQALTQRVVGMPSLQFDLKARNPLHELIVFLLELGQQVSRWHRQRVVGIFQQRWQAPRDHLDTVRQADSVLQQNAAHVVTQCDAVAHQQPAAVVQTQNGSLLRRLGVHEMLGRCTASQIASASLRSFLFDFRYGLTKAGAISRTVWPNFVKIPAQ